MPRKGPPIAAFSRSDLLLRSRQVKIEIRSLARLAVNRRHAPVVLDDAVNGGQVPGRVPRPISLVVKNGSKSRSLGFLIHSDPGIPNGDFHIIPRFDIEGFR